MLGPTGHTDTFTRDNLPPFGEWPEMPMDGFDYPE
jgi:2-aminobenzoate-CoA ligase